MVHILLFAKRSAAPKWWCPPLVSCVQCVRGVAALPQRSHGGIGVPRFAARFFQWDAWPSTRHLRGTDRVVCCFGRAILLGTAVRSLDVHRTIGRLRACISPRCAPPNAHTHASFHAMDVRTAPHRVETLQSCAKFDAIRTFWGYSRHEALFRGGVNCFSSSTDGRRRDGGLGLGVNQ